MKTIKLHALQFSYQKWLPRKNSRDENDIKISSSSVELESSKWQIFIFIFKISWVWIFSHAGHKIDFSYLPSPGPNMTVILCVAFAPVDLHCCYGIKVGRKFLLCKVGCNFDQLNGTSNIELRTLGHLCFEQKGWWNWSLLSILVLNLFWSYLLVSLISMFLEKHI